MSTAERVLDVLAGIARTDAVRTNLDIRLYDQRILDSHATVRLIVAFEEAFGLEFNDVEFSPEEWATPDRIIKYMERKVSS